MAQHTVYEADLVGMILGIHLIKTEQQSTVSCVLSVDNQAALIAINLKMTRSRQHLAARLHQMMQKLHKTKGNTHLRLTFHWSAGHVGIVGNEDADRLVKEAASGDSSAKKDLPLCLHKKLGYSLSAARQAHYEKLKRRWTVNWTDSPRYCKLQYQDLLMPYSQKFLKYLSKEEISRKAVSLIFQLRVGHAPINLYLHRFKKVDSPYCPASGHPKETVEHVILQCPGYNHERWPLLRSAGSRFPKLTRILSSPKLLVPLANLIDASGRFDLNTSKILVREHNQRRNATQ